MSKKLLMSCIFSLLFTIIISGCTSNEEKTAISEFTKAVANVETLNTELDQYISEAEALITANETPFDSNTVTALETAVSTAKSTKISIPEQPQKLEEIKNETEKLNKVDYSDITQQILDAKKAYEDSIKQLKQVTAPTEAFVIERVQAVEGITGVSAVTEENDPNGNLGKQGGYTAQVYFSYNLVDQTSVSGNSIIDKGTDCGGSIEVYNTAEEAENRNAYLASFDGGIFASGSHTVVGTTIIRTSDKLTASQQKELETKLINSLIALK